MKIRDTVTGTVAETVNGVDLPGGWVEAKDTPAAGKNKDS